MASDMNKNRNTKGMKISYKERAQSGKTLKGLTPEQIKAAGKKPKATVDTTILKTKKLFKIDSSSSIYPPSLKKHGGKMKGGGKMGKCKGGC